MKPPSMRLRALLAALLPVTLVAALLTGVFLFGRVNDLDIAHQQRALAQARQVAAAAEFGMFSRNQPALQALTANALREPDVRAVTVLDATGEVVARAGVPTVERPTLSGRVDWSYEHADGSTRLVVQPIASSELPLAGEENMPGAGARGPQLLGYVALELSRDSVAGRESTLLLVGLLVTAGGLLVGSLLALWLVYDVTAELGAKREEAEVATLAKTRFLAAASHDLRQPMHALGLFVERLGQLRHDPETDELIKNVDASVHALQDLLDGLLDISRLDAGVVTARHAPVAVAELWAALHRGFAEEAGRKGLALRLRPSPLWIRSDALLLHRLLLNLVSNAVRYTERGGVLVSCRARGARALIEVRDTGPGIPREMQAEVFKEFVQLGNPERDRSRGLGLGLTIVERSAKLLGHPLRLRSQPGRGSCFTLEVPVARPGGQPVASAALSEAGLAGVRVLVVDDDRLARVALAGILESWGCRVSMAADDLEALRSAGEVPDLIACDFRLARGVNGIELVGRLRAATGRVVPAFIVSGDTDPLVLQAAREAGLPLLQKPVRASRLRALVQRLLSAGRNP